MDYVYCLPYVNLFKAFSTGYKIHCNWSSYSSNISKPSADTKSYICFSVTDLKSINIIDSFFYLFAFNVGFIMKISDRKEVESLRL